MLLKRGIPLWFILAKIRYELVLVIIFATVVYLLKSNGVAGDISVPGYIATILGTTIALLLGFRTNQAYDRWWEARKVWGAIVNDSRTLIRQVTTFTNFDTTGDTQAVSTCRSIAYRQIAWCYSLGQSLRGLNPLEGLEKYLPAEEIEIIKKADNKPNHLIKLHSKDIQKLVAAGTINHLQQQLTDETLTKLCDSMGMCERIKNTVFPRTYSMFVEFFVYLFVIILPFSLLEDFGIVEIPLTAAIASAFFLIEKTAIHMQDPFENKPTDTPVTAIARTIEINLKEMMGETAPEKLKPNKFYIP